MSSGQKAFAAVPRSSVATRAISVGDKLPNATLKYFDSEGNMKEVTTDQLCKGKKVVLFAVPGAFTPTCSMKHLPGFIDKADEIKAKGVGTSQDDREASHAETELCPTSWAAAVLMAPCSDDPRP